MSNYYFCTKVNNPDNTYLISMLKALFEESPNYTKLMMIVFIMLCSFLIITATGTFLSGWIFSLHFADLIKLIEEIDYNDKSQINILKYLQFIQSLGLFVIPPFIIAYFFSNSIKGYLKINTPISLSHLILAFLIIFSVMPLIELTLEINSQMRFPHQLQKIEQWMKNSENNAEIITKAFLNVKTFKGLAINIALIAIIPAIGEELIFRGVLVRFFSDWTKNAHAGILISAIIFSIIHFQFYGFLPRMILGVLFGYLFVWSGTLWIPIILHFINNAMAIVAYYLQSNGIIIKDPENLFNFNSDYLYLILSLVSSVILIWVFRYFSKNGGKNITSNQRPY